MKNVLLGAFLVLALLIGVLHASGSFADVSDGGSGVLASGDHLTVVVAPDPASTLASSYSITGETNHAQLVVRLLANDGTLLAKAKFRGGADESTGQLIPAVYNSDGFRVKYTCRGRQPSGTCEGATSISFD